MRRHPLSAPGLVGLALPIVGLALSGRAAAHGPSPAALEVVDVRDGAARVVRLNFGLAVRRTDEPTRFRYLCPGQWGESEDVPPVGLLADASLVVPGVDEPMVGDPEGCAFRPLDAPDWAGQTFISRSGREPVLMVTRDAAGSSLWSISGAAGQGAARRLEFLPGVKLDSVTVAADGSAWMLSARPTPRIYRRTAAGLESRAMVLPAPDDAPQYLALRWLDPAAPDHFLFAANVDEGVRLYETTDGGAAVVERLRAAERLHGPVPLGDDLVATADGVWHHRRAGDTAFAPGEARAFTCLQELPGLTGQAIACLDRQLVRLEGDPANPDTAPFFDLSALSGPQAGCPGDPVAARRCAEQWLHFGAEAGLAGAGGEGSPNGGRDDAPDAARDGGRDDDGHAGTDATVVPPVTVPGPDGGCGLGGAAAERRPTAIWAVLLALVPHIRRRSRSNFSKPSRIP